MTEARRAGARGSEGTSEELASALRAKARSAATTALREGLEEIDGRYGERVAEEVASLIDVAEVFAGLVDKDVQPRRKARDTRDDDEPWEFKPMTQ
jgi:hypothetical protein